jgi:hypothetical protein
MPSMILVSETQASGGRTSKSQKAPNKEVPSAEFILRLHFKLSVRRYRIVPVLKPIWVCLKMSSPKFGQFLMGKMMTTL